MLRVLEVRGLGKGISFLIEESAPLRSAHNRQIGDLSSRSESGFAQILRLFFS